MWSASIGARTDPTDCPLVPSKASRDEQVVILRSVSENRAVGDTHTLGADASGLRQYTVEITADDGECAESGKLRLLLAEPSVLCSKLCIKGMLCGTSRLPSFYQTGPKTSANSGCSCSMREKRCISGRNLASGIVGIRS